MTNSSSISPARLIFMYFAPPLSWGVQLLAGYGLAALACATGSKLPFFTLSVIAGLVTLSSGVVSFITVRERLDVRDLEAASTPQEFVAAAGVLLALVFFLLIAATGLFGATLNACSPINMALP